MGIHDIVNYISTRMISPDCFGFSSYLFGPQNYSLKPAFGGLLLAHVPINTDESPNFLRVVYRRQ